MKKITVEINLEDLYDEDAGEYGSSVSASELITNEIKQDLKRELSIQIKKQISERYEVEINEYLQSVDIFGKIKRRIDNNIDRGDFRFQGHSLQYHINKTITESYLKGEKGAKYVNSFIKDSFKELTEVYDREFAIGIFAKLNENNLLTPQAQAMLVANSKKETE